MADHVQTWRRKLRLQELVDLAKKELESGKENTEVYEILDQVMQKRWRFVDTTKRQYLDDVKKILANQYVLVM
jgi:regulator of sirC expression with transglutaminase-like and TPR domain